MSVEALSLRPARAEDADYARRLYFDTNRWIIERLLGWDEAYEIARFAKEFRPSEARIVSLDRQDIGWFQAGPGDHVFELKQICIKPAYQGRGIGSHLILKLVAEAKALSLPIELTVARINRAVALYTRLGFTIVGTNEFELTMRRE